MHRYASQGSEKKVKNSDYYLISLIKKIITIFLGILITVLISRYLGKEKKGIYAVITNYTRIAVIVALFGQTIIYPNVRKEKRELESTQIKGLFIFDCIIFIICTCILLIRREIVSNLALIVLLFPFELLSEQVSGIAMIQDYRKYSMISVLSYAINTICCFLLLIFGDSSVGAVIFMSIIKYVFISIACSKIIYNNTLWNVFKKEKMIYCIKMGIIPMLTALLGMINYQIDVVMLDLFEIDYSDIGLYSTAVTVSQMVCMFPDAFKEAIASKNTQQDCKDDVAKLSRISFFVALLCIIISLLFGKLMLKIVFGEEYVGSFISLIILLVGNIPMIYFKLIGIYYQVNGKYGIHFIILLSAAIANVLLNVILIPYYGIIGAGIASVGSYLVSGGIYIIVMCKDYKMKLFDFIMLGKSDIIYIKSFVGRKR